MWQHMVSDYFIILTRGLILTSSIVSIFRSTIAAVAEIVYGV